MQTRQASNMTSSGLSLLRSGPQAHFSRVFLSREMMENTEGRKAASLPFGIQSGLLWLSHSTERPANCHFPDPLPT